MYTVPLDLPKNCNKCPFGRCVYSKPFWGKKEPNYHDGQIDLPSTHGYICEIKENYDEVLRADFDKDIEKPVWCPLVEIKEQVKPNTAVATTDGDITKAC